MNILYINHYAGSLELGMEFRPYYMAREWMKKGHNVRIVAAEYSHLRSINPTVEKELDAYVEDGIEYRWIKTCSYGSNGVKRLLNMLQFSSKAYFKAKKLVKDFKPDLVITSSTYPLDTYAAQRIAKLTGATYIHEGHDLWPLTLTTLMGMSKLNPFVILLGMAERSVYKNADKVVSVLAYSWKHMLTHGLDNKEKFKCIPNGVVLEDWEDPAEMPDEHRSLFESLKSQNKKIVCYLGGHMVSNKLDVLVDAALKTTNPDIAYVFIGKGTEKERLIERAKGASNIFFLPPVSKKAVPTVLGNADFLYVGAEKCSLYEYGVSMNKVYDYMMAGKPIIYGVEAANNDVEDAHCGKTIDSGDPDSIIKAVEEFMAYDPEELEKIGQNGRKAVLSKYNYKVLAEEFLELI